MPTSQANITPPYMTLGMQPPSPTLADYPPPPYMTLGMQPPPPTPSDFPPPNQHQAFANNFFTPFQPQAANNPPPPVNPPAQQPHTWNSPTAPWNNTSTPLPNGMTPGQSFVDFVSQQNQNAPPPPPQNANNNWNILHNPAFGTPVNQLPSGPQMRIPGNNQSLSPRLRNSGPISPANRRM